MTASLILAPLQERSVDELLADLQRVRDARTEAEAEEARARTRLERLQIEEATLEQLLTYLRAATSHGASSPDRAHLRLNVGAAREEPGSQEKPATPRRSKRPAILRVMRDQPEREAWTPREVRDALAGLGIEASTNLVRLTLRRMHDAGQIARVGDRYKLAPGDGAENMGVG